jgi:hypothetical protein
MENENTKEFEMKNVTENETNIETVQTCAERKWMSFLQTSIEKIYSVSLLHSSRRPTAMR